MTRDGFYLLMSLSGRCKMLAFACESCHLRMTFAEDQKDARVTHCGRTDTFSNSWWNRLRLETRKLQRPQGAITFLGDAGQTVEYAGREPKAQFLSESPWKR